MPPFRTIRRYRGSLTTPLCTEGVAWVIPDTPLSMSAARIAAFAALYPNNRRPVQPLGDRVLCRGWRPRYVRKARAGGAGMKYDLDTLRGDLFGGVTSVVVALPIDLGFGIASGMGAAGLYGAIAVGFFASVFGGTRSLVSGPSGPMTVAMAVVLTSPRTASPKR